MLKKLESIKIVFSDAINIILIRFKVKPEIQTFYLLILYPVDGQLLTSRAFESE